MKTNLKIFLVDDDLFSLNSYMKQLQNFGYSDITILQSGEECIRRLNEKPHVIFLDHIMDQMSGLDVLQKIKRYYPNIHVVIVSGSHSVQTAVTSLKLGATDYILKGEDEPKRMRSILQQINTARIETIRNQKSFNPLRGLYPVTIVITILFILQSTIVIYYYSSLSTALFSMVILTLVTGIGFGYNQSSGTISS